MDQRSPLSAPRPAALSSEAWHLSGLKLVRTAVWMVCHFVFYFIQQVAELFAPLLLIGGVAWSALPTLIATLSRSAASADPQARDAIASAAGAIPQQLVVAGHVLTASGLIWYGVELMALAAAGATLAALSARNL
ncbi:MAG: hypothetical protein ABF990_00310 [Acetobacter sp.]|uniref:hypothetical protein n=1 Tax=Acetobacter sp. TaxID=440 RepID=UPI0039E7A298